MWVVVVVGRGGALGAASLRIILLLLYVTFVNGVHCARHCVFLL